MKRIVYSPQLNSYYTVIEQKGNALYTKEGACLSSKMCEDVEKDIPESKFFKKELELKTKLLNESLRYYENLEPACYENTWISKEEKELARQLYKDVERWVWGFDEDLFRNDINKTVNQDFYD